MRRVILVAGHEPKPLPEEMRGTATFIYIPTGNFGKALYPLEIPVNATMDETEVDWHFALQGARSSVVEVAAGRKRPREGVEDGQSIRGA